MKGYRRNKLWYVWLPLIILWFPLAMLYITLLFIVELVHFNLTGNLIDLLKKGEKWQRVWLDKITAASWEKNE